MIRIAICDDDSAHREKISSYIGEYAESRKDTSIVYSTFFSPKQLLNAALEYDGFDIYILDVLMPEMSGIELGVELRKTDVDGKIIYLTSTPEFGVDSYLASAFFYLLKPVDKDKLFDVIDRAVEAVRNRKGKSIMVKSRDKLYKISFDDILYVELNRRSLIFFLSNGTQIKSVTVRTTFAEAVEVLLRDERFFVCGASLAINLYHVIAVEREAVVFKKDERMYCPRSACPAIRSAWFDFWLKNGGNL